MEIDSIETRIDNIEILENLLDYAKECASDREESPSCIEKAEKIIDIMTAKKKVGKIIELFKSGKATQEQWREMGTCVYIVSDQEGREYRTEKIIEVINNEI